MTTQTVGGWALLLNALLTLLLLLHQAFGGEAGVGSLLIGEALSLLLIVGLLALWPILSGAGRLGRVGILCLGLAAGVAFSVRLVLLLGVRDVSDVFPATSAVLGFVGSVLVGWATYHTKIFHPIIGWLLIIGGTLNLIGGSLAGSTLVELLGVISTLTQAVAFAGYGATLLHPPSMTRPASWEDVSTSQR